MMETTEWFAERGWGVFCHYLGAFPSTAGGSELSAAAWNAQVDAFDVTGLARQLEAVRAPYFCITLGQNSGHFLSPNAAYDRFVGIEPSKCSRRDLVADLYDALHPHGIELLVYLPSGAPAADPVAMAKLEWEWGFEGGWPQAWGTQRTGKRLAAFQLKWEAVIREWSLRWGPKVRGWWIDGCYFADEMYRHGDAPNFASFAAAMKAGNPDSLVAFNPGVTVPVICHTEFEDYTAGEISEAFPTCPGPWVERNGHRARYHILSYLGTNWCQGDAPRFPDEFVVGYTRHVNEKGGVVTWDVPILKTGLIPDPFVKQLGRIGVPPPQRGHAAGAGGTPCAMWGQGQPQSILSHVDNLVRGHESMNMTANRELPPLTERSRNLVRFSRHLPHEQLHDWFAAAFAFRAELSRFSFLKNYGTLPGPDEAFSHLQLDARPLFEKLLGLEMDYPGTPYFLQPYSSMNYYRSHIEEVFHHSGPQHSPFPPVEGRCVMFFTGADVLRVEFELRNKSAADVAMRLRWFSIPSGGLSRTLELLPDGFRHACVQKVTRNYEASAVVTGCAFQQAESRLESAWEEIRLPAKANQNWSFEVRFNDAAPQGKPLSLAGAIDAVEARYAAMPELPAAWRRFEPLALKAAGILLSNRFLETDPSGNRVPVIHGGKTGVEATWFWDSCTSLLGVGLMKDAATGWGTYRLLCDGIAEDGKPFVRYCDGRYAEGAQNPILAWGVWNFHALCPDREQLARAYPALKRYVGWWLRKWDLRGQGLHVYASGMGCTGLDDALQWCENFPIALRPGEAWHSKDWGPSRPDQFESVDTNCHLYLEMKALARIARVLDLPHESGDWALRAATLGEKIHARLFNPEAGVYQARSIVDDRFNRMISLESFLPIYAGITPQPLAQKICREFLLNPDRFYTTLPFPTLDRANEAFRSSGTLYQPPEHPGALVQQAYWIGRAWLNYSYWMVGALNEAGLVQEADAAAEKILDAVSRNETIYECYDPLTGTGTGHAEFPWGAAATLALAYRLYRQGPLQDLK